MNNKNLFTYFLNVILKNVNLSNDKFFSYEDVRALVKQLPENFKYYWNTGASKLVIIPLDYDWVIKIPFNGYKIHDEEIYFDYGSNDIRHFWDYCFTESFLYQKARAINVAKIFAKEIYIGNVNGYPIYTQYKVKEYKFKHYELSTISEKKLNCIYEAIDYFGFTESTFDWLVDAIRYYGIDFFKKVLNFLNNEEISDLHNENIGYLDNGRPIIIDYSSYNELI